ncbi:MAG: lactate utilization protein [Bacillota bacterium]|nr:lactate utilization protein [Bacillota bacterium]
MEQEKIDRVMHQLERNGFHPVYFETREEAVAYLLKQFHKGQTVGFGGSMTLKILDIPSKVEEAGGIVIDHSTGATPEEKDVLCKAEGRADLFLSSSNAITEQGFLVNCDGTGNRVAAMIYGPSRVIVVAGKNKICANIDEAMERIETLAAPPNVKRLHLPNPCGKTGHCIDCNSPTRICCAYTILKRPTMGMDFTVVLIGETLGF